MKSRKSFALRLDPSLYDALEKWAAEELRSVNGQIEYVLRTAVLKRGRQEKSDAPEQRVDDE